MMMFAVVSLLSSLNTNETTGAAAVSIGEKLVLPSVSILLPTNSRPEFVQHALAMIRRQDYPANLIREVVIVDDSPTELKLDLKPGLQTLDGLRLDVVLLEAQMSIGEKRNLAVARATGEILVHWDDDDFYGAQRLR